MVMTISTIKENRGCSSRLPEKPRERGEVIVEMMMAKAKKGEK